MKFNRKNLPQSEIELQIELAPAEWGEFVDEAIRELSRDVKIDGFRPGHAPEDIVEREVGQGKILEKAADLAVKKTYVNLITENKIEAISRPEIQVTKLVAPPAGGSFEFKVKVAVMPEVKLGDWRAIAKGEKKKSKDDIKVEEKEVDGALEWLVKSRTKYVTVNREARKGDRVEVDFTARKAGQIIEGGESKNHPIILGEGHFVPGFEDNLLGMKENERKTFSLIFPADFQDKNLAGQLINFEVKLNLTQESQMPEMNDEFAKSLGAFENMEAVRKNIKEGLLMEKEEKEKSAWRAKVLESIAKKITIDAPKILVDVESEKMLQELQDSIARMGLDFESYLKSIDKSAENLKTEWRPKAEERVKAALILRQIAFDEKIEITEKEIEEETSRVLAHFSDAHDANGQIDMERLKEYTKGRISNEKAFQLLESLS